MPSIVSIPGRTERRCKPCEFHRIDSAFYGSDHSWQAFKCTHPQAMDDLALPDDPVKAEKILEMRKRIDELLGPGRHIGRTERQPDWCPLRKSENEKQS